MKKKEEEYICGCKQVAPKPNVYKDSKQKICTFEFLIALGWKFNEEKGIWWKEGIKDENGVFINVEKRYRRHVKHKKVTTQLIKQVVELHKAGWRGKEIVKLVGLSITTINIIKKNEGLSNRRNRDSN